MGGLGEGELEEVWAGSFVKFFLEFLYIGQPLPFPLRFHKSPPGEGTSLTLRSGTHPWPAPSLGAAHTLRWGTRSNTHRDGAGSGGPPWENRGTGRGGTPGSWSGGPRTEAGARDAHRGQGRGGSRGRCLAWLTRRTSALGWDDCGSAPSRVRVTVLPEPGSPPTVAMSHSLGDGSQTSVPWNLEAPIMQLISSLVVWLSAGEVTSVVSSTPGCPWTPCEWLCPNHFFPFIFFSKGEMDQVRETEPIREAASHWALVWRVCPRSTGRRPRPQGSYGGHGLGPWHAGQRLSPSPNIPWGGRQLPSFWREEIGPERKQGSPKDPGQYEAHLGLPPGPARLRPARALTRTSPPPAPPVGSSKGKKGGCPPAYLVHRGPLRSPGHGSQRLP